MRFKTTLITLLTLSNLLVGQTYISDNASGLWTTDYHPFILTSDAVVPSGDTLVIEPGVAVDLGGSFELRVQGVLIANGSHWSNGGELFGAGGEIMLSNSRFVGLTAGIRVYGGMAEITTCIVDSTAETGITLNGTDSSFVRDCDILNSGDYGIKIRSSEDVEITGNTLSGNSTNDFNHPALFIDSASPETISNNIIENNHAQGVGIWSLSSMAHPTISNNIIRHNFTGITLVNSNAMVENNIIVANYHEGNTNSGAGIYAGYSNSTPIVMYNYIAGNYYGVSNINSAVCNLGDMVNDYPGDDGMNIFFDNSVGGETWNIWNATPAQILAQNNYWPGLDLSDVDATLWDNEEGGGEVLYEPIYAPELPGMADLNDDTVVNILDVVQIVEGIVSGSVQHAHHFYLSDINNDYYLDVNDLVALVEIITAD